MAAASITAVPIPHDSVGYNLTDSSGFATLVSGAGNGVKFAFADDLVIVLKNDTAGTLIYTFKAELATNFTSYGVTIVNPTKSIAAGKTWLFRLSSIFKNLTDQMIYVECNGAGKVLVLDP